MFFIGVFVVYKSNTSISDATTTMIDRIVDSDTFQDGKGVVDNLIDKGETWIKKDDENGIDDSN